jgi:phosphoglycolate phosphatase-like HAD superfamily hydrolase
VLRHIRLLILDLDYLVFDCAQLKTQAIGQSLISLADLVPHHGALPGIEDAEAGYREHGSSWVKHLEIGLDQQGIDDLDHAFELHERRLVGSGAGGVYPGVKDFLLNCVEADVSLALGAYAKRDYMLEVLERHQLDYLFQIAMCADEFGMGDADEMMLEIMRQLEVNPSETLMMGTRPHAFQAAKSVNVLTIGCGWGILQHGALAEADLRSRTVSELDSAIRKADSLVFQSQEQ